MTINELLEQLVRETTGTSLVLFAPELTISITIVALLLMRLFDLDKRFPSSLVAIIGTAVGMGLAARSVYEFYGLTAAAGGVGSEAVSLDRVEFFTGLMVFDSLSIFFRGFLFLFLAFVLWLTLISGIPDQEDGADFYVLLLGSVLGMLLMCSANHLLMVFMAIEMASIPSYVLVGYLKGRKVSSEAALKYVVYGSGAAGVMLYGISLLCGLLGTAHLPTLGSNLTAFLSVHNEFITDPAARTLVIGLVMLLVGVAFKLSLFPFHFWCPDAFEGAAAEVGGFLSVASKAAAFAVLVRICLALIGEVDKPAPATAELLTNFGLGLGFVAATTITFGNLAAYTQANIKRMLAYSTIAHAGYMLLAIAAMLVLAGNTAAAAGESRQDLLGRALHGLLFYLTTYFFMNLGAFGVIALIRNQIYSEKIEDYKGIGMQSPAICAALALCLFSLVGLPPLAGFPGKLAIFSSVYEAGLVHEAMFVVLVIASANTAFSLYYYMRVVRAMFISRPDEGARQCLVTLGVDSSVTWFLVLICGPVLALGTFWIEPLKRVALTVANLSFY